MRFRNRSDAGKQLANALLGFRDVSPIVLALPRGGVPVAAEVAKRLHAPLELVIVRKLGLPQQPELAMGAVVDTSPPVVLMNDAVIAAAGVSSAAFSEVRDRELAEARRRRVRYVGQHRPLDTRGRTVIVVDDGIATGATMRAAVQAVRTTAPRRIIVAAPVGPPDAITQLRREADDVICLSAPADLGAIQFYYEMFDQVTDREVTMILRQLRSRGPADSSGSPASAS